MFKNIQKYLLINHPILWNTKVVPATVILLVLNLIFFIIGFNDGELNFNESESNYTRTEEETVLFFGFLIAFLLTIIWLVFYLKNNSFKTFYPKKNTSLFKEFMILFLLATLICSFALSFFYGRDARARNYFSENEAKERCKTLSMGSFFLEGSYSYNGSNGIKTFREVDTIIDNDTTFIEYVKFRGKRYESYSLINKNKNSYSFFDSKTDSLNGNRLCNWLVDQQKDSLRLLFKNYLSIVKEHNLKTNIDENKWLELINDYPDFNNYKLIGNSDKGEYYDPTNYINTPFDNTNKYLKKINDSISYEYYKYYVPDDNLSFNYDKISLSWTNPKFNLITFLMALYVGFGIALLIFSFRVTSVKNWFISLISLGVFSIVFGVATAVSNWDYLFAIAILTIGLFSLIYFFVTLIRKKSKNISAVFLNSMLWLLPTLLPIIYFLIIDKLNNLSEIYLYEQKNNYGSFITDTNSVYYKTARFMEDYAPHFMYINLALMILIMLLLSFKIKKWRGLAEG